MYSVNKIETFRPAHGQGYESSRTLLIFCLLITALFCLTAASNTASAATYYLDAVNGDDGYPGTATQPWKTISKAQASISDGDTVILRTGNYGNFFNSTVRSNWVLWKADTGQTPVFSGLSVGSGSTLTDYYLWFEGITIQASSPLGNNGRLIQITGVNHLKFINCNIIGAGFSFHDISKGLCFEWSENIEVKGCKVYGTGPDPRKGFDYAIYGHYSHHVTIDNCDVTNCGLGIGAWGKDWHISNCELHHLSGDGIIGFGLADSVIEDNDIYNILLPPDVTYNMHHADCLQFYTDSWPWYVTNPGQKRADYVYYENITVRRNRMCHGSDQVVFIGNFIGDPDVPGAPPANNFTFENNLMYDAHTSGTFVISQVHNLIFINNTILASPPTTTRGETAFRAGIVDLVLVNNIIENADFRFDEGITIAYENNNIVKKWATWHMPGYVWGNNTIAGLTDAEFRNNLFADYDNDNYQLKEGSLPVDFANSVYAPTIDVLGNPRDAAPDAGCYEYISGTPDTTPPLPPTNLISTAQTENSISFSWTAPGPASDGDLASRYRIYCDGTLVGTVTNTSFQDTDLAAGTSYSYEVYSVDDAGNQSVSAATGTFSTSADTTPPVISNVQASTASQATITWNTNENSTSQVEYGLNNSYGNATTLETTLVTSHSVLLSGLAPAIYHYRVRSKDASGNESISQDNTFTTSGVSTYSITASAGNGGQISPSGTTQVASGGSQTYTITANSGYDISDVLVDGSSVGAVNSYPFTNVTANHTITATFVNIYTITATAGNGGQISPSGTTQVSSGGSQTYTITANSGYDISDIVVDGSSVGAVGSYPFTNVTANHTIAATFGEQDVTAPTVTNLSPQADSIQAPLNTLVILHVVDAGKGVDANSVTIKVNNNEIYTGNTAKYSSTYGDCYRMGTKADYKFVYQANESFDFDQSITITVDADDLAGNNMDPCSYSFDTEMRSFGKNKKVGSDTLSKGKPVTVRDNGGNIWAAWHAGPAGSRDIYVGKLTTGADNFGNSIIIRDNSADQCNPVIAVGSDDKLYVAWQDNRRGNWDIYVSTSSDGINWSTETRVTDSNDNQINPAIVVDSSNNAYIAWEDDRHGNQDIYIATSSDGFSTNTQITSDSSDQVEPAIAADSDNTIYVVWTDTRNSKNDIYGAASNNGPWTNIPIVNTEDSQSSPVIATEAVGSILHLVWVDDRPGDDDIYYAQTAGGLPGSPLTGSSIIDDTTDAGQKRPVIAVSGSTGSDLQVFACWQDERNADDDLYLAEISSGSGTNVFVGDNSTNTDQTEPAIGIDGDGHPYLVWTDSRNTNTDIYYTGSTFIEPDVLASNNISTSSTVTVGTPLNDIDSVDDVSVVVPAGAYPCDIMITISKITNPLSFVMPCLGAYDFGPSGIEFSQPVTVTIPYNATESATVAYWYNSLTDSFSQQGITDIETIEVSLTLHALRFKTTHFTPFYIFLVSAGAAASGGGGGGGCSMSPDSQASVVELLLPYMGLTVAMVALKLRDRRKRKALNITKSEC